MRKIRNSVSLTLFLDPLADLVTGLDSKILLRKKILSGIFYRYTWGNCKVTNYGKTFSNFFTRAFEHMETSNQTGKCITNAKELAISDYLLQCDFRITFDDFDFLGSDSNKFKLIIKENLLIKRDKQVLNRTTKSFLLDLFV